MASVQAKSGQSCQLVLTQPHDWVPVWVLVPAEYRLCLVLVSDRAQTILRFSRDANRTLPTLIVCYRFTQSHQHAQPT